MIQFDKDLKSLLDIPEWEIIQDQIAKLTGTAIITIDVKGIPISKHSMRTDFCSVIRENPISRKRCFKCDALAGLEAVRTEEPYIYLCHCGIVDVAVPVVVGDRYLGAVMFGQVRLSSDDKNVKVERLISEISSFNSDDAAKTELLQMYNELPEMSYERIVEIANLIDSFVHYIIKRVMKSRSNTLAMEYLAENNLTKAINEESATNVSLKDLSPQANISDTRESRDIALISSSIYPAVDYIEKHKNELVAMQSMAKLCHLSPSYFSRIFLRDTGENFVEYLSRKKIGWSKERLANSNDAVSLIAFELGYQDTSYFIKVFKKFEGITPAEYRKDLKRNK